MNKEKTNKKSNQKYNISIKVLSVEDSQDDFQLIEYYIKQHFPLFTLEHVTSINSMHDQLENQDYDLILLDLFLDGTSSTEHIPYINLKFPNTEIIVVSGQPDIKTVLECINAGASYIVKGDTLETDLVRSISEKLQLILKNKEINILTNMLFTPYNFPSVIYKEKGDQISIWTKDFDSFPDVINEPIDTFLTKIKDYSIMGMDKDDKYKKGIFQLVPNVPSENFHVIVYSFRLQEDIGSDKGSYFRYHYALFIPDFLYPYLPSNYTLEQRVSEIIGGITTTSHLKKLNSNKIKLDLIDYLRNNISH